MARWYRRLRIRDAKRARWRLQCGYAGRRVGLIRHDSPEVAELRAVQARERASVNGFPWGGGAPFLASRGCFQSPVYPTIWEIGPAGGPRLSRPAKGPSVSGGWGGEAITLYLVPGNQIAQASSRSDACASQRNLLASRVAQWRSSTLPVRRNFWRAATTLAGIARLGRGSRLFPPPP